ncbi:MAG: PHP domain-containing protein [Bacteroidia bacterium]|nr:PHP domain-containing protein [Bacteroidia bacterium]
MTRKWLKYKPYLHNADCQMHTMYTDGKSMPEAYFKQAEANGIEFIVFSEHIRKVPTYDFLKFKEHVYRAGAQSTVKFAVGAEAKVLNEDGDIDISNELANEAEIILFSFHTPNFPTVASYQKAIRNAALNPWSDVFAHPTCYHNWQNMAMTKEDWAIILNDLATAGVCYEFNKKYPLPNENEIAALNEIRNLQFVFGSDAHESGNLLTQNEIDAFRKLLK